MITAALWESEFPDIPMPPECDYWTFYQLTKRIAADENRRWTAGYIKQIKAVQARADPDKASVIQTMIEEALWQIK